MTDQRDRVFKANLQFEIIRGNFRPLFVERATAMLYICTYIHKYVYPFLLFLSLLSHFLLPLFSSILFHFPRFLPSPSFQSFSPFFNFCLTRILAGLYC